MESNDEAIAAYLLSQEKIDLNIPDRHFSPLMRAVCKNNETMAQLLLDHNADINYKNKNQKTALMTAAGSCCSPYRDKKECNYQGIIKLLLRAQPAINMENEDGETALHYAVENRCFNTVKLLLEAGADSSLKDKCQQTALDKIQKQIHDFAQRKEKFTEIHTMLNSKASTNNHE
ncbi:MAG: ankyrin repeat domain-containing protein [Candidatus Babeliales bacterium]